MPFLPINANAIGARRRGARYNPVWSVKVQKVVDDLTTNSLWDKVDILYLFNETEKESTYQNIKGNYAIITESGTISYDKEDGIQSDGATGYLDTHHDLSSSSVVTKDDCCLSIYINGSMVNKSQGWIDATVGDKRTGLLCDGSNFYSQVASNETLGNWIDMGTKPYPGMIFMDTNNDDDFASTTIKLLKNGTAFSDEGSSIAYFAVTKALTSEEKITLTGIIEEYLYGSQYLGFYVNNPATVNQITLRISSEENTDLKVRYNDGGSVKICDELGFVEDHVSAYTNINCYNKVVVYGDLNKIWYFKTETASYITKLNLGNLAAKLSNIRYLGINTLNSTTLESSTPVFSSTIRELYLVCVPAQNIGLNMSSLPAAMYSIDMTSCSGLSGSIGHFTQVRKVNLSQVVGMSAFQISGWGQYLQYLYIRVANLMIGDFEAMIKSNYYNKNTLPVFLRDNDESYTLFDLFAFPFVTNIMTGNFTDAIVWYADNNIAERQEFVINLGASSSLTGCIEDLLNYNTAGGNLYVVGNSPGITFVGNTINSTAVCRGKVQTGLLTANLDSFLISLASSVSNTGAQTLDMRGINQPRTSASDAAITTLLGLGKTIQTN